jgi:soluble lytic murein transglycosylase
MRVSIVFGLCFFIFAFASCSSGQTRPPSADFIQKSKKSIIENPKFLVDLDLNRLEENERQYVVFESALKFERENKKKAACDRFKYLGKDKTFPLSQYALIKSLGTCNYLGLQAKLLWNSDLKEVQPHFEKEFLEKSMALALKREAYDYYVNFGIKYTDSIEIHKDKEKHLKKLLSFTRKKNLKELQQKVREKLIEVSPRYNKRPKVEDYFAIAKDYSRVRSFKLARAYYKKVFSSSSYKPLERIDAYERYAMTYKLQRQKKKYSWRLEKCTEWIKSQKDWFKDSEVLKKYYELRILSARAQWTVNYRTRAEKNLKSLLGDPYLLPDFIGQANWLLGSISVEKKQLTKAKEYFEIGFNTEGLEDETLERLSWSQGWAYYLDGNLRKAKDLFYVSSERTKDRDYKNKLIFWQAKILKQIGQPGEASLLFKKLTEIDPYGYYGIAAAMEEKLSLKIPAKNSYDISRSQYPTLDWLVTFELYDQAQDFLKSLGKEIQDSDDVEEILPLYHLARWYEGGIFKFYSIEKEKREEILGDHLPAIFPLAFKDSVLKVSKKTKLPASLIFAIARQESAFNEKVRSWADAFGLLQLTPEKAKSLARKYKIPYSDYTDLFDVEKNLLLGSLLLNNLAENNNGQFIPFVASYNAGARPVRSWQKERFRKDPFEFIEMIPYKETRNYIKLVLRNLSTYKRLLGETWKEEKTFFSSNFTD